MPSILDIAGKRFGRLVVVSRAPVANARNAMWLCQCDCGNTTVGAAANLGKTKLSCGCLAKETAANLLRGNTIARTHNLTLSPEYRAWSKLKMRCYCKTNPKYPLYGARGISVCDRWRDSFEAFYSDMGPRPSSKHSIERKNNDGDYEPSNCVWAPPIVQARNNRQNTRVTIDGQTFCISEWIEKLRVPKWKPWEMIRNRGAKRNLPPAYATIEDALAALYHGAT